MTQHLVTLYPWMLLTACICATAFPVLYMVGSPWWETIFGRCFLASRWSLALALDETWVFLRFQRIPWQVELWIAHSTFAFLIGSSLAMLWLLRKAQRQGHPLSEAMKDIDPTM